MTVTQLLDRFLHSDLPRSMEIFCPEIVISVTIVLLLLSRLMGAEKLIPACWIALFGTLVAFTGVILQFIFLQAPEGNWFLNPLYAIFRLSPEGVGTFPFTSPASTIRFAIS